MAIIYTYPTKASPAADDLILISDSADSNKTKQIKVSSLPSSGAGITLTTTGTSGPAELNGTVLNIPNYTTTGGTPDSPVNSVQFNNAGAFGGSNELKYDNSTKTLTVGDQDVFRGIVSIAGGSSGAGELRLGDPGTSGGTVTLKGGNDHAASYTIKLPDDSPSANNKILESDASGNLTWITTPSSSNTISVQDNGGTVVSGINTLNFNSNISVTTAPGSSTALVDVSSSSNKLGFTPLSIYEARNKIASQEGENGQAFTSIRQSVCETDCTIDKVDFFRLNGTDRVTVAVYTGTIASGTGNLRLLGGQSSGISNQINTITFNTPYTFSAGDDIIILVSLQYGTNNDAEVVGDIDLIQSTYIGRQNTTYYSSPETDFSSLIGDFTTLSQSAAALHFYKS